MSGAEGLNHLGYICFTVKETTQVSSQVHCFTFLQARTGVLIAANPHHTQSGQFILILAFLVSVHIVHFIVLTHVSPTTNDFEEF